MDRAKFYDALRGSVNLTTQNVEGMEHVLNYAERVGSNPLSLPYVVATAWWESGQTMHPVREAYWKSEAWRKANLRYYPFYGRGLVQTTWERNYIAVAKMLGLPERTFADNPDLLLEWEYALPALFRAMETGLYTGKSLKDYIDGVDESDAEDLREFINARRIINGTDKAAEIGKLALVFERALKAGGYTGAVSLTSTPPVLPQPPAPPVPPTAARPEPPRKLGFWAWLWSLFSKKE